MDRTLPIAGYDALVLTSRLAAVCGRPLVAKIGEVLALAGPGPTSLRSVFATATKDAGGMLALLGAAADALGQPDAAPLVRALCRYGIADGRPLLDDEAFNNTFTDDPWSAIDLAVEVALARGLFSRRGTSLVSGLLRAQASSPASAATS